MVKITVITVVYNAIDTIERTIRSVFTQSYTNIEYIIIDGGSTDGTLGIIHRYRDRLAYFVSEPDRGIYDAMNKGIQKATGDIIGLLNADDWYEPDGIEAVVTEYKRTSPSIIAGGTWMIKKNGEKRLRNAVPFSTLWKGMMCHQAIFISRKAYEMYGLYDTDYKIAADYELLLRMYHRGATVSIISDILVNYSCTGVSSTAYIESAEEANLTIQKYKGLYKAHEAEISRVCTERLKRARCSYCLENFPLLLASAIYTKRKQKKAVIWGTGSWGSVLAEFCCHSGIQIDFFVDSDEKKQKQLFYEIDVKSPIVLQKYIGIVFIAVKDYDVEIAEQLVDLNNEGLRWMTLRDFIDIAANCYDKQTVK